MSTQSEKRSARSTLNATVRSRLHAWFAASSGTVPKRSTMLRIERAMMRHSTRGVSNWRQTSRATFCRVSKHTPLPTASSHSARDTARSSWPTSRKAAWIVSMPAAQNFWSRASPHSCKNRFTCADVVSARASSLKVT